MDSYRAKRRGVLLLAQRNQVQLDLVNSQDPEVILDRFRRMVELLKPELVGCRIQAVTYDVVRACWVVAVEHESLPIIDRPEECLL